MDGHRVAANKLRLPQVLGYRGGMYEQISCPDPLPALIGLQLVASTYPAHEQPALRPHQLEPTRSKACVSHHNGCAPPWQHRRYSTQESAMHLWIAQALLWMYFFIQRYASSLHDYADKPANQRLATRA